jgi:hypothetical protein
MGIFDEKWSFTTTRVVGESGIPRDVKSLTVYKQFFARLVSFNEDSPFLFILNPIDFLWSNLLDESSLI